MEWRKVWQYREKEIAYFGWFTGPFEGLEEEILRKAAVTNEFGEDYAFGGSKNWGHYGLERVTSAQISCIKWPIWIEGTIPSSSWWLMVLFVQINQGSKTIVCSYTIACFPSGLVGIPVWMASHLIPFGGRPIVGETLEDDEVFEVVKALNGDKALGPDTFTVGFFQAC
jgi:hypothetical protein